MSQKLVKRGISLKNLEYEKIEQAAGQSVRQKIKLKQGIASDHAKKIVATIKDSKLKAQASIQGETVRVVSKDKDVLQQIMAKLRGGDYGVELQFTNFRSTKLACRQSGCAISVFARQRLCYSKYCVSTISIATASEVSDLLRDDLAAVEREFARSRRVARGGGDGDRRIT